MLLRMSSLGDNLASLGDPPRSGGTKRLACLLLAPHLSDCSEISQRCSGYKLRRNTWTIRPFFYSLWQNWTAPRKLNLYILDQIVSLLYQNRGGIGKSIPDAWEIPRGFSHAGSQMTSWGVPNSLFFNSEKTWLTRGPQQPFRCLDYYPALMFIFKQNLPAFVHPYKLFPFYLSSISQASSILINFRREV